MIKNKKTILVTGGAGYVGSTFIRDALAVGYCVRCLDLFFYGGGAIVGFINHPNFDFFQGDIRDEDTVEKCLVDVDYVVHLAAIVGDKQCQAAPKSAYQINYGGTKMLAELSKKAKVKKFVFASTCANYGISDPNSFATENTRLNPVSLYAETKIDCERLLQSISNDKFAAVSLRFGSAFGVSFRTRFDLVVNSFAFEAWNLKKIVIFSANTWRPYIHVSDMAFIILNIFNTNKDRITGKIFNAGSTKQNYTKQEIVETLVKLMPQLQTKFLKSDDRRDYKVSFEKLESLINFEPSRTIKNGYEELLSAFHNGIITKNGYDANTLGTITDFFGKNEKSLAK